MLLVNILSYYKTSYTRYFQIIFFKLCYIFCGGPQVYQLTQLFCATLFKRSVLLLLGIDQTVMKQTNSFAHEHSEIDHCEEYI